MQEERRLAVLRAIVQDYVATQEPVGSKALVERHGLGVSPATIRNDMAALEEEGLIAQPHTSAGRVPTDAGYRLFVDRLGAIKPMSVGERRAIESFLNGALDVDDVVQRSVRLLAQLTRQVAIVQYPILSTSTVRHIELVALTETRLLLVLILSNGRVEQRMADLRDPIGAETLADVRRLLHEAALGKRIADASTSLRDLRHAADAPEREAPRDAAVAPDQREAVAEVVAVLVEAMDDHRADERVVVGGTANLASFGDGLESAMRPLLEALEEHVVLLRLIGEASTNPHVTVRIGAEGPISDLATTSVVASGYGPGDAQRSALGVVGPTRMDYPSTMAAVRAVARYVSNILDEN